MAEVHIAVVPVGKIDSEELEHGLVRAARAMRCPLELTRSLTVPQGVEDTTRRQFRAADLMTRLRSRVAQLDRGKPIGAEEVESTKLPPRATHYIFVTDVDMFTEQTDGVFSVLNSAQQVAVVSVRRLRESFYRRPADRVKQRSRTVKEILRMAARLRGVKQCPDPTCALAASKSVIDLDIKEEAYCRKCSQWLFHGSARI